VYVHPVLLQGSPVTGEVCAANAGAADIAAAIAKTTMAVAKRRGFFFTGYPPHNVKIYQIRSILPAGQNLTDLDINKLPYAQPTVTRIMWREGTTFPSHF